MCKVMLTCNSISSSHKIHQILNTLNLICPLHATTWNICLTENQKLDKVHYSARLLLPSPSRKTSYMCSLYQTTI